MKKMFSSLAAAAALAVLTPAIPAFAQGSVSFVPEQKSGEVMAYRLGGTRVFNGKGEVIGHIADVVLDAKGQAQTVVIGLGGVLGLGSKLVGVPYSAVKFGPVVESSRVVLLDMTVDQLNKAPAYKGTDPGKGDRAKQKASEWAKKAKDTAVQLSKQAGTAIEGMREKMSTPQQAPATPAPAPKQ